MTLRVTGGLNISLFPANVKLPISLSPADDGAPDPPSQQPSFILPQPSEYSRRRGKPLWIEFNVCIKVCMSVCISVRVSPAEDKGKIERRRKRLKDRELLLLLDTDGACWSISILNSFLGVVSSPSPSPPEETLLSPHLIILPFSSSSFFTIIDFLSYLWKKQKEEEEQQQIIDLLSHPTLLPYITLGRTTALYTALTAVSYHFILSTYLPTYVEHHTRCGKC